MKVTDYDDFIKKNTYLFYRRFPHGYTLLKKNTENNLIITIFEINFYLMAVKNPTLASATQKENFKNTFAEIVKNNEKLQGNYSIHFFDTLVKSNYVINGLNGKSISVLEFLSFEERESYKELKASWQN